MINLENLEVCGKMDIVEFNIINFYGFLGSFQ